MRINNDGNVGIGTTSPDTPLHVSSTGLNAAKFTRTGPHIISRDANFANTSIYIHKVIRDFLLDFLAVFWWHFNLLKRMGGRNPPHY